MQFAVPTVGRDERPYWEQKTITISRSEESIMSETVTTSGSR